MDLILAIDFGSTFTKVAAFDLAAEKVAASAQAGSTVDSDINHGLDTALDRLAATLGERAVADAPRLACSSAAGGLRMVVAGLVRELTTQAAREACLGAGAKLIGTYSNGLIPDDVKEIEQAAPDIVLLTGGTDGGNGEILIGNATLIAASELTAPVIVAGNRRVAGRAVEILERAEKAALVVDNVLPELDSLNVEPARRAIRDVFMARITRAKGLDRARQTLGRIIMPTPAAVLNAAELLARGTDGEPGLGPLVVVDVGGATTDVHSVAHGRPADSTVVLKGLPEPLCKRTVEGDLGIRLNAPSILELVGRPTLEDMTASWSDGSGETPDFDRAVADLAGDTGRLPESEEDHLIDAALSGAAVRTALARHSGVIEEVFLPTGRCLVQRGKDLRGVGRLIGTGGVLSRGRFPEPVLEAGCFNDSDPASLRPGNPEILIDRNYLLYAIGLLAGEYPAPALRIIKKTLHHAEPAGSRDRGRKAR